MVRTIHDGVDTRLTLAEFFLVSPDVIGHPPRHLLRMFAPGNQERHQDKQQHTDAPTQCQDDCIQRRLKARFEFGAAMQAHGPCMPIGLNCAYAVHHG